MAQASTLRYEVVEGWEQLPAGWSHRDVAGVATDAKDRVYLFSRADTRSSSTSATARSSRPGARGVFTSGRTASRSARTTWSTASTTPTTPSASSRRTAKLLFTLGISGQPSDTGYDGSNVDVDHARRPARSTARRTWRSRRTATSTSRTATATAASTASRPTAADPVLGRAGHRAGPVQPAARHLRSSPDGRVFVADRENDRIQIFSPDGEFLTSGPTSSARPRSSSTRRAWSTSPSCWRPGHSRSPAASATSGAPGRVSVLDPDGNVLARWRGGTGRDRQLCRAARHRVDSHGDIYVAEVTYTSASAAAGPADCHTFQKFART